MVLIGIEPKPILHIISDLTIEIHGNTASVRRYIFNDKIGDFIMEKFLIIGIVAAAVLVATILTISHIIRAEKSKSLFVKIAILVPFYVVLVGDIVKDFEEGRSFLAILGRLVFFILALRFIFSISADYEK